MISDDLWLWIPDRSESAFTRVFDALGARPE
jgi:hypothetical protein